MIWMYTLISTVWSAEIVSVDRPSVGTSAYLVEKGGIQLESGLQIDGSQTGQLYSLPTMIRVGLHDRLELRPYTSILTHTTSDTLALQTSGVQAKVKIAHPESKQFSLSILASSDLSAGSGMLLLDAWQDNWSVWVNAGHSVEYDTNTGSSLVLGGVGYALPKKQGLFLESSAALADTPTVTIEGGYTKAFESVQIDVYTLKNLTTPDGWQIATGVGWRLR